MRFLLDFSRGTGLRSGELVRAELSDASDDDHGERWIEVVGKGNKTGRVSVPPQARLSLDQYLAARGISTSPVRWKRSTPLVARIKEDGQRLTGSRLWVLMKRFFTDAATELEPLNAVLAEKLRKASPHWMRHTHATHALEGGASLTTVRDNLRHASVATTSIYLHTDERRRAKELAQAFGNAPITSRKHAVTSAAV
jgi:site-specific recombinase XerD